MYFLKNPFLHLTLKILSSPLNVISSNTPDSVVEIWFWTK